MDTPTPVLIRRRPSPPDAWQEFTGWPGSASLVTLLSAACLLAGLWGVLAPTIGESAQVGPRWSVLLTLSGYLACLLAATWAMCRVRIGNPDAVAAAVVGAAMCIGFGVVIDLIAPDQPAAAACAAGAGLLGMVGLWRGWQRMTGGSALPAVSLPLLALMAWSCGWPVVLGVEARRFQETVNGTGTFVATASGMAAMRGWTVGYLLVLAIAGWMLVNVLRSSQPWADPARPFLSRPALRWILVLVALAAAGLHLFVQGHAAGLDLCWSDFLPLIGLLALIANELRARAGGNAGGADTLAGGGPVLLSLLLVLGGGGAGNLPEDAVRGSGWAPHLVSGCSTPPAFTLWFGTLVAWLAWRRRSPGLASGAGLALLVTVLTWDGPLRWAEAILSAAVLMAVVAGWLKHAGLLLAAGVVAEVAVALVPDVAQILARQRIAPWSVAMGWAAFTVLGAGILRPGLVGRGWARLAAWALLAAMVHLCWRSASPLYAPVLSGILLTGLLIVAAWRRHDRAVCWPLLPVVLVVGPQILPERRAWIAVWAAFALLAGAVGLALQKASAKAPADPDGHRS